METRAHHFLIGAFMLIMTLALFAFLIWFIRGDSASSYNEYDIFFEESVAGLPRGSDVLFNGIPVGRVTDIRIAPNDPSQVQVSVQIQTVVPVSQDSVARLSIQGLTGVLFVEISGGNPNSAELRTLAGRTRPIIRSEVSAIQRVFASAPELLGKAGQILDRIESVLSDENLKNFEGIMADLKTTSSAVATRSEALMADLSTIASELKGAMVSAKSVLEAADGFMQNDLAETVSGLNTAIQKANQFLDQVNGMVADSRGAVTEFANVGLPELTALIGEARDLATALSGLAELLESDPTALLFSTDKPTYKPE